MKKRVFQLAFFICSISHVGPISESSPASSSSERSRDKAMENDNRLVCVFAYNVDGLTPNIHCKTMLP